MENVNKAAVSQFKGFLLGYFSGLTAQELLDQAANNAPIVDMIDKFHIPPGIGTPIRNIIIANRDAIIPYINMDNFIGIISQHRRDLMDAIQYDIVWNYLGKVLKVIKFVIMHLELEPIAIKRKLIEKIRNNRPKAPPSPPPMQLTPPMQPPIPQPQAQPPQVQPQQPQPQPSEPQPQPQSPAEIAKNASDKIDAAIERPTDFYKDGIFDF